MLFSKKHVITRTRVCLGAVIFTALDYGELGDASGGDDSSVDKPAVMYCEGVRV